MLEENNTQEIRNFFESELFHQVQMSGVFNDSKTFADAMPNFSWSIIYDAFTNRKDTKTFDIKQFVLEYFTLPEPINFEKTAKANSVEQYIAFLWEKLEKQPDDEARSSLLPLNHPYVVPGGRFREIYYWDSYFTALGLIESGREDLLESMILNFIELQDKLGQIPNGNRHYYWSRSQPPVLSLMVERFVQHQTDKQVIVEKAFLHTCINGLEKEHAFWMSGAEKLSEVCNADRRVVKMPDGSLLNRYWDDKATPRPESYREDIEEASVIAESERPLFYRNIRAACESGWDFSSRWLKNRDSLETINTTQIVPVDLNCLLFKLEQVLAKYYLLVGNNEKSQLFDNKKQQRKLTIDKYLWNAHDEFYFDYDFEAKSTTSVESLAAVLPLFVEIANKHQAEQVYKRVANQFLAQGGLITTLSHSQQQWDSPNGWAPLHWFAVVGLKNYGFFNLVDEILERWIGTVESYFSQHAQLMEKYDVLEPQKLAQGGEYEVQHGFGWTNGVTLAFYRMKAKK